MPLSWSYPLRLLGSDYHQGSPLRRHFICGSHNDDRIELLVEATACTSVGNVDSEAICVFCALRLHCLCRWKSRPMSPLLEDRPRVAECYHEAGFLYLLEIGGYGAGCRNCRHKVRSIFLPLILPLGTATVFRYSREESM
jgi:hypothetical protein